MSLTETELLTAAMELNLTVRARIAERLLESVGDSTAPSLTPAWVAEIQRRVNAYDRSETQAVPGDQVIAELKAKYRP